jgi:hypothetical protein
MLLLSHNGSLSHFFLEMVRNVVYSVYIAIVVKENES